MKAIVVREHGGPEVLRVQEVPTPEAGPGEARVRVKACGLNHIDLWLRKGQPPGAFHVPMIPGADVAGVVEAVGPGVDPAWVGRSVLLAPQVACGACPECLSGRQQFCDQWGILGEMRDGGYAEYVVVPRANLFPLPGGLSFEQAACVPLTFLTAWHMLAARAQVRPGETVLIHAAGSGVSTAGIQIARLFGARVLATAGSPAKLEHARGLGAEAAINYREQDFAREVRALVGRAGVDVVFDHVGRDTFAPSLRLLKRGGRYVTCGTTSGNEVPLDLRYVFFRGLSILGSTMGTHGEVAEVFKLVDQGRLRPVLDSVFPLERASEAHARLEARQALGNVVLSVG
jgi:NADPH:quinone reductase-like Zn-dependent oxidoreductase